MTRARGLSALAALLALTFACVWTVFHYPPPPPRLRVCADPNNLPFSNSREEGFENRLATLLAEHLHRTVEYTWWAQRRGFVRETLRAHACDVIMGVPTAFELVLTSRPYYRASYTFVSRTADDLRIDSLDDPRLRRWRVGVQMVGDDFSNSPPAHALSERGAIANIVGYSVFGDYREPNPPARIIDGVASGVVDVAIVWGPLAGYFASRAAVPLTVTPVQPSFDLPFRPFVFDMSMGVRREDSVLRDALDDFITKRAPDIARILDEYHVPRLSGARSGS
jgi:quinoprotein dehydrogenase-associated probable ABC transporter substrate-binding protein